MASENGLDIQQIQRQWEDSQRTLSDLRARLQTMVSASESAQMSTDSIKSAETSLARLAEQNQESTKHIAGSLRRTVMSFPGPRTRITTSPGPSVAPNNSTSVPVKPVVMATRWFSRSATKGTDCAAAKRVRPITPITARMTTRPFIRPLIRLYLRRKTAPPA